jgi:hypothetical protein
MDQIRTNPGNLRGQRMTLLRKRKRQDPVAKGIGKP